MPRHPVVASEEAFYYRGSQDFDELLRYLREVLLHPSPERFYTLQDEGVIRFRDNYVGTLYYYPGTWWTRSYMDAVEDAEFRERTGPVPEWPQGEPSFGGE